MADGTPIEWTQRPGTKGASWNPIRAINRATGKMGWHCTHDSEGCRNCYAEAFNRRLGTGLAYKPGHERDIVILMPDAALLQPLRWKAPRTIFVGSMTDIFGSFVSPHMLDRIFAVAALCPQHTFIMLTKRAKRMRSYALDFATPERIWYAAGLLIEDTLPALAAQGACWGGETPWPLNNVWLGVSAEDQKTADQRVPELLDTPAAVRFVSAEPLLGPIDFHDWLIRGVNGFGPLLDWIIVGGESGRGARPMHPAWARSIRDQCAAAGVRFFFKQWGEWEPVSETRADSSDWGREWMLLDPRGVVDIPDDRVPSDKFGEVAIASVGKRRAGRLLDGVEHNAFPESRP